MLPACSYREHVRLLGKRAMHAQWSQRPAGCIKVGNRLEEKMFEHLPSLPSGDIDHPGNGFSPSNVSAQTLKIFFAR